MTTTSPTPWTIRPALYGSLVAIHSTNGRLVLVCEKADAERIVACVNACDRAAFSNEALDHLAAGDFAGFLRVGKDEAMAVERITAEFFTR